ncbi:MAG: pentapeptide repeat-containing protein, partial [Elainellaceae cyanobacterium]
MANLQGVDLSRANCTGTDFIESDLRNADLSGADLTKANLCGANIEGASLDHAKFDETIMPDSSVQTGEAQGSPSENQSAQVLQRVPDRRDAISRLNRERHYWEND